MYTEYFGLADSPFSIAPDPRYLYLSDQHREALAHLIYGVGDQGGFIVLTGEVGTGKTTICRSLLQQIPSHVDVAFVINPKQSVNQLLQSICKELSIHYQPGTTSKDMVDLLNSYLLKSHAKGRNTVLIIDEAQNLSVDILEQLRLLTNLETNEKKLLQLVLIGQPELNKLLALPELRQLSQRVTARYHLPPLTAKEVSLYIAHRLSVARCHSEMFTPRAVKRIYRISGGIPRLINLICDRSLLGVYSQNGHLASSKVVKKAASEVIAKSPYTFSNKWMPYTAVASVLLFIAVLLSSNMLWREVQEPRFSANEDFKEELSTLLKSWEVPYQKSSLATLNCHDFQLDNLFCYQQKAPISAIIAANTPAIIAYRNSKDTLSFLLLKAVVGDQIVLEADGETFYRSRTWLESLAVEKNFQLKRLPNDLTLPIEENAVQKGVGWLESSIAKLTTIDRPITTKLYFLPENTQKISKIHHLYSYYVGFIPKEATYDVPLQSAVRYLKREYGLEDTATVDKKFVSHLLASINKDDPRLAQEGG